MVQSYKTQCGGTLVWGQDLCPVSPWRSIRCPGSWHWGQRSEAFVVSSDYAQPEPGLYSTLPQEKTSWELAWTPIGDLSLGRTQFLLVWTLDKLMHENWLWQTTCKRREFPPSLTGLQKGSSSLWAVIIRLLYSKDEFQWCWKLITALWATSLPSKQAATLFFVLPPRYWVALVGLVVHHASLLQQSKLEERERALI